MPKRIQIYGDSIMRGTLLNGETGRYYNIPADTFLRFGKTYDLEIDNRARFGNTITRGRDQLLAAMDKGLNCEMILMEYGGNDCDFNWSRVSDSPEAEHLPNTPPEEFEHTYLELLTALRSRNIQPIVLSLPPIDAERYLTWICRSGPKRERILSWLGDVQMIYRFQELYSDIASRVAMQTGSLFVDVRSAFLKCRNFAQLLCQDGIHPNEAGQRLLINTLGEFAAAR